MRLAGPGSKKVIFAVLYEPLELLLFTTDYVLGLHL